jgi:aldose sugar dehydrogenase
MVFGRDGTAVLTVGERQEQDRAQDGDEHGGKVLRLRRRRQRRRPTIRSSAGPGYLPEIYSARSSQPAGARVASGTGAMWENEHGPLGGDEINVILPGATTAGRS